VLYYRALGVRIGRNVRIHELALLGEYDLITLGDNVTLDHCVCRPFAAERNTSMLLQPIQNGSNSTVGLRAVLAPGCNISPGTCLGPNTSSWETKDAGEFNRVFASAEIPKPHWIWYPLVVEPLRLLVGFIARLPALAGTLFIVNQYPNKMEEDVFKRQVLWFANSTRMGQLILVKVCGAVVGPFTWFLAVFLVKRGLDIFCGRPQPGPYKRMSGRQKLRSAVLDHVFPRSNLGRLTRIIGTHYEAFSVIVRMLGARAGKRIYWPIDALTMIEDYDMLEVGNDVVFGSRSSMMTADGVGRERIMIGDGAFVGDRVVALPGVTIGKRTTVGSGALLRRDGEYPDDTAWAGSRQGDAVQFPQLKSRRNNSQQTEDMPDEKNPNDDDTISPFGRAFYEGQANYRVLGMGPIVGYSTLMAMVTAVYPTVTILTSLMVVAHLLRIGFSGLEACWWRPFSFYALFTLVTAIMTLLQVLVVMGFTIATKRIVLGQRKPGYYPWDTSSYCQRWQIMLTIEKLIDEYPGGIGILTLISGTAYLPIFYRAMGATVGKDCALAADGNPDILWTEPDLVTFGDRVTADDASVICHLNTRGEFEMNPLRVGNRSVLRAGSRLLSGASMSDDACLLEHTLVLSGDHVDDGRTVQGWPCEPFSGDRLGGFVA
jgi:acetyltransferase-like isoleucine patch superfamily enzyme